MSCLLTPGQAENKTGTETDSFRNTSTENRQVAKKALNYLQFSFENFLTFSLDLVPSSPLPQAQKSMFFKAKTKNCRTVFL
jgi:hypothetical protein